MYNHSTQCSFFQYKIIALQTHITYNIRLTPIEPYSQSYRMIYHWCRNVLDMCRPTYVIIMVADALSIWRQNICNHHVGSYFCQCATCPVLHNKYAVECRYNAVQYNTIMFTAIQRLGQNLIRGRTHGRGMGSLLWGFGKNGPRYNGTACIASPPCSVFFIYRISTNHYFEQPRIQILANQVGTGLQRVNSEHPLNIKRSAYK